jgi:hypothetical protein
VGRDEGEKTGSKHVPLGSRRGACDLSPPPSSVWRQTCLLWIRTPYHQAKLLFLFRFPFRRDNAEERRLLCGYCAIRCEVKPMNNIDRLDPTRATE